MALKQITNEQEYQAALRIVEPMFDNEPSLNTPEGDYFNALCLLIEQYEKKYFSVEQKAGITNLKKQAFPNSR